MIYGFSFSLFFHVISNTTKYKINKYGWINNSGRRYLWDGLFIVHTILLYYLLVVSGSILNCLNKPWNCYIHSHSEHIPCDIYVVRLRKKNYTNVIWVDQIFGGRVQEGSDFFFNQTIDRKSLVRLRSDWDLLSWVCTYNWH